MASDELRKFRLQRAKDFAAPKPTLPDIAKQADDLQAIKETVDSAATVSGALWLSYLFVMFYIAVAAGAVTHEDLLLQRPVRLPFLNVELPLLAFFFLAPLLFVATHIYTIVHFNMLGQKAARFHAELHHQLEDEKEIRDKLRRLLPSNVLVQIFAGPPELREGRFGLVLKAIAILTLLVCPVLLLLLLQIQFLPYHAGWITWTQRGALMFDIAILWILRPPTLLDGVGGWSFHGGGAGTAPKRVRAIRFAGLALTGVLSLLAIWLSVVVATIPDEWQEKNLAALDPRIWRNPNDGGAEQFRNVMHKGPLLWRPPKEKAPLISTRERLFAGEVDPLTRRRKSLFSNTLVLPGFDIYVALKVDDKTRLDWKDHLIDLRSRALDGSVFEGAKLPKSDLTGARLQGASFEEAQLQGASLDGAQLQGASLNYAQLQRASFNLAQLQGASLKLAHLQGASFFEAQLQGASLDSAKLQGATLYEVQLQGASLDQAELQGASLSDAQIQGASLDRAQLQGASLGGAKLQGASLNETQLQGAVLVEAQLQGASLNRAQLQGALLGEAQIQGASLEGAYLWRASWYKLGFTVVKPILFIQPKWEALYGPWDQPWTDRTYDDLRVMIEKNVPQGDARENALELIARVDCKKSGDDLASCDSSAKPPPAETKWRALLEAAQVDDAAYAKALAQRLRKLVCGSDVSTIHILRGISRLPYSRSRLAATGHEAPALIEDILKGNDCPISAALTDADKAGLQEIKAEALKKYPPAQPPEAAKAPQPSPAASPSAPPAKAPAKGDRRRSPRDRPPP